MYSEGFLTDPGLRIGGRVKLQRSATINIQHLREVDVGIRALDLQFTPQDINEYGSQMLTYC